MKSVLKQWWERVNYFVYFILILLAAFTTTYLVVDNNLYVKVYQVESTDIYYFYENNTNTCKNMSVIISDQVINFPRCVFKPNPLLVYFYDDRYETSQFKYMKFVEYKETVTQLIVSIFGIFIGFLSATVLYYSCGACILFCIIYKDENKDEKKGKERHVNPEVLILKRDILGERCVICLDNFLSGQKVSIHHQTCKKVFHTACLEKYFATTRMSSEFTKCPLCQCRFDLNP